MGGRSIAIVMRSGTDSEMMSGIGRDDAEIIKQAPGVLRDAGGPVASAELFVIVDLPKRSTGTDANVPLRGVQANAMEARNGMELVSASSNSLQGACNTLRASQQEHEVNESNINAELKRGAAYDSFQFSFS